MLAWAARRGDRFWGKNLNFPSHFPFLDIPDTSNKVQDLDLGIHTHTHICIEGTRYRGFNDWTGEKPTRMIWLRGCSNFTVACATILLSIRKFLVSRNAPGSVPTAMDVVRIYDRPTAEGPLSRYYESSPIFPNP